MNLQCVMFIVKLNTVKEVAQHRWRNTDLYKWLALYTPRTGVHHTPPNVSFSIEQFFVKKYSSKILIWNLLKLFQINME